MTNKYITSKMRWQPYVLSPWGAFTLALIVNLTAVLFIGHYKAPTLWENGVIAKNLIDGIGFTMSFSLPNEPTSWQAPGYPWLLATAWQLVGLNPKAYLLISLLQAVALASMVFPVRRLAERWFGPDASVLAGYIVAIVPIYAWYATRLHHTALVMAFHPWLLSAWLDLHDHPTPAQLLATGVVTGIAGLFQPVLLAVFGLLSSVMLLHAGMIKQWRAAALLLIAGLITLAVLTPWTVRNYLVHDRILLVKDSLGKELWMGNNPHATGTGYALGGREEITNVYPPTALSLRGRVPEIVLMEALQREALGYIIAEPITFVRRTLKKILWYWTITPQDYLRSSRGGEALKFRWLHLGYWSVLVGLFTIGLAYSPARPREYLGVLLLYVVVYSLVYGITHVGQARFRGEIEFIFLPGAAAGLFWLLCRISPVWIKMFGGTGVHELTSLSERALTKRLNSRKDVSKREISLLV